MMLLLGLIIVACWILVYVSEEQEERARLGRLHRATRERRIPANGGVSR